MTLTFRPLEMSLLPRMIRPHYANYLFRKSNYKLNCFPRNVTLGLYSKKFTILFQLKIIIKCAAGQFQGISLNLRHLIIRLIPCNFNWMQIVRQNLKTFKYSVVSFANSWRSLICMVNCGMLSKFVNHTVTNTFLK